MCRLLICLILLFCVIGCGAKVSQHADLNLEQTSSDDCRISYDVYTRIIRGFDIEYIYFSRKYNVEEADLQRVEREEYDKAKQVLECFKMKENN